MFGVRRCSHFMNRTVHAVLIRPQTAANACVLAAALVMWAFPSQAGQSGAQFNVTVNLQSANSPTFPQSVFCRTSPGGLAFGATVTVVCSTGAVVDISPGRTGRSGPPMHGGAYRYVTQVLWNGDWVESLDDTPGIGTITSWRFVSLLNRNYVELTVGW